MEDQFDSGNAYTSLADEKRTMSISKISDTNFLTRSAQDLRFKFFSTFICLTTLLRVCQMIVMQK